VSGPPSHAEAPSRRERWLRLAGVGISVLSLAAVAVWAARQPAPTLPHEGGQMASLAAAILVYALATLARGERWAALLRRSGAHLSRPDAYGLTVVGYMGNNVLPARGGDAMRVVLATPRAGVSMRTIVGTLLAERLLDVVTLLALFAVLAYGVLRGIHAPSAARLGIAAGIVAALALAALAVLRASRHRPAAGRLAAYLAPVTASTLSLRGRFAAAMLAATAGIWALEAATYLAVAGSAGLGIEPLEALYIVAVASVFVLVPAGPGYLGTLDAAIIFGVKAVGGSGSQAVSFLLALRFVLLVPITLAGLAILLARYGGFARARAGAATT